MSHFLVDAYQRSEGAQTQHFIKLLVYQIMPFNWHASRTKFYKWKVEGINLLLTILFFYSKKLGMTLLKVKTMKYELAGYAEQISFGKN